MVGSVVSQPGAIRTGSLKLVTVDALGLVAGSLNELQHRGNSSIVTRIDIEQNTLERHVLVL